MFDSTPEPEAWPQQDQARRSSRGARHRLQTLQVAGQPKAESLAFAGNQLITARERFRTLLSSSEAQGALRDIALLAHEQHVVLICFEEEEARCHRAVVAEELVQLG